MHMEKKILILSKTDTGPHRSHNEDRHVCDRELGLAILADGMGGHRAGEVASSLAVTFLAEELKKAVQTHLARADKPGTDLAPLREEMQKIFARAHETIAQVAASQPQYHGMGTTAVLLLFHDNRVLVAHVGDSRAYRFRKGGLEQITTDHTIMQELIRHGMSPEEAKGTAQGKLLSQALGASEKVEATIRELPVEGDDVFLLCSDGLTDMVLPEGIQEILRQSKSLEESLERLVKQAIDNGGQDNVTVILAQAVRSFPAGGKWYDRFLG